MTDYQQILFPYAYNILGAVEDARDVVQDVLTTYIALNKEGVENEKNYLIKMVINRAINNQKRNRRTVGQSEIWLPEPIATEDAADRDLHLREILSYSLMVLLEKLNALERAVFILRESFDYSHQEIAEVLSIEENNSRKLLSRAKSKLFKPAAAMVTKHQHEAISQLLENYIDAIRAGDIHRLENLLSGDITYLADGGSKIKVIKDMCVGSAGVAKLLILIYERFQKKSPIRLAWVNHQPAFLYYWGDKLSTCQVFGVDPSGSRILQINNVVDPEKLKYIERGI